MIWRISFCCLPAVADAGQAMLPDAPNVQQHVGIPVNDVQCSVLVEADNLGGQMRTDPADRTGAQVPLDAFGGRRMRGLQFGGFELLAMVAIHNPLSRRFNVLARRYQADVAHDGDQVASVGER